MELIEASGGPTPLAKRLKLSGPSYLCQLSSGLRPITEKTARKYERMLGLAEGYLDRGEAPVPENKPFPARPGITQAVVALAAAQEAEGVTLSAERQGELLEVLLDEATRTGEVSATLAAHLVRLTRQA